MGGKSGGLVLVRLKTVPEGKWSWLSVFLLPFECQAFLMEGVEYIVHGLHVLRKAGLVDVKLLCMDVLGKGGPVIFIHTLLFLKEVSHLLMEVLLFFILSCHLLHHLTQMTHFLERPGLCCLAGF